MDSKIYYYIQFLTLFIIAQSFSMMGQFITIPYKNLTYFESLKMALPFCWVDWFFQSFCIKVAHEHQLTTPSQDIYLLIIIQFTLILIINQFYLKKPFFFSDVVAFVIILFGFWVSFNRSLSGILGLSMDVDEV